MPSSKSPSEIGIRTQTRRIPIKGYTRCGWYSRSNLSLSRKNFGKEDPDIELKELITEQFKKFHERYGYKRITKELKKLGYRVNHKKVYRLMRELGLKCVKFMRKSRKYNSYKGNVGKVAKNRLSRRFYTPIPLQKLVTDITEFKCLGEEKLYLNPLLDLYNGE